MSKHKLNIAELVFQGLSLLCLFLPWIYTWEHWEPHYLGGEILAYSSPMSFVELMGNISILLGFLVIAAMIANGYFIIEPLFKGYPKKFNILHKILPIAVVVFLAAFTIIASIEDSYGYCGVPNWLFYFEAFFVIAVMILAFLKCSRNAKSQYKHRQAKQIRQNSNIDELKKLKELLDMGIITQEEFNAKKRQLLGL